MSARREAHDARGAAALGAWCAALTVAVLAVAADVRAQEDAAATPAPPPAELTPAQAERLKRKRVYAVRQARWQMDTVLRRSRRAMMKYWEDPPRPDPATLDGPLNITDYRRPDGTRPMWTDNGDRLSMTVLSMDTLPLVGRGVYADKTRLDIRLRAMHTTLPLSRDYRDHDGMPSLTFRALEITNPELGTSWLSLWQGAGIGARWDGRWVGVELGAFALAIPDITATTDDGIRLGTPFAGLRVGEIDRGPRVALHAQFPTLFAFSFGDETRSLRDHVVVFLKAEHPTASPYIRLQARGQYRDIDRSDGEGGRVVLRDAMLVVGPEIAAEFGLRAFPLFVGLGARRVKAAGEVRRFGAGRMTQDVYEPEGDTHFVVFVSTDLGMYGATTLW